MAILGTFIDKQTISRLGDAGTTAGGNVQLLTASHSLPATNPEVGWANIRSLQAVAAGAPQIPIPFSLGGNASLITYGYWYNSAVSTPTMMFDLIVQTFHSIIR